jgi:carbon storage regulator CsrA
MLILTRKIDQSIIIQGNITVMVLGVERDRVKLGIAAPENIAVLREELVDTSANAPLQLRPRRPMPQSVGNLALKPQAKRR